MAITVSGMLWAPSGTPRPACRPPATHSILEAPMTPTFRPAHWLALLCALLFASTVQAQSTRTWVSGVGDDANPCSRTAPCKTFAGAIGKTAVGGVISVL